MNLLIRQGTPEDATACAEICYHAFVTISHQHNFPPDFPSPEVARELISMIFSLQNVYPVVAEADGQIVGSNFLWEDTVCGIGPITVNPKVQNAAIGRRLMEKVLEQAAQKKHPSVRLVQAGYHNRSLSLYTKLGFQVREPLATLQGPPLKKAIPGFPVRPANRADMESCQALCRQVHGHERRIELAMAVERNAATVVERNGKITGYTTGISFFAHTVGESNDDVKALISAAVEFPGPGFLLPMRNGELFRWCLANGLRVVQPMNLMSLGLYNEPSGAFLPSVLY